MRAAMVSASNVPFSSEPAGALFSSAKAYAETRIKDYQSQGSGEVMRRSALLAAKKRLGEVVDHFGLPEFVDQAQAMLSKLP